MRNCHPMIICCTVAGTSGCQHINRSDDLALDALAKVTFKVTGMMKTKSGAT